MSSVVHYTDTAYFLGESGSGWTSNLGKLAACRWELVTGGQRRSWKRGKVSPRKLIRVILCPGSTWRSNASSQVVMSRGGAPNSTSFRTLYAVFFRGMRTSVSLIIIKLTRSVKCYYVWNYSSATTYVGTSSDLARAFTPIAFPSIVLTSVGTSRSKYLVSALGVGTPQHPSYTASQIRLRWHSVGKAGPIRIDTRFFAKRPLKQVYRES